MPPLFIYPIIYFLLELAGIAERRELSWLISIRPDVIDFFTRGSQIPFTSHTQTKSFAERSAALPSSTRSRGAWRFQIYGLTLLLNNSSVLVHFVSLHMNSVVFLAWHAAASYNRVILQIPDQDTWRRSWDFSLDWSWVIIGICGLEKAKLPITFGPNGSAISVVCRKPPLFYRLYCGEQIHWFVFEATDIKQNDWTVVLT